MSYSTKHNFKIYEPSVGMVRLTAILIFLCTTFGLVGYKVGRIINMQRGVDASAVSPDK